MPPQVAARAPGMASLSALRWSPASAMARHCLLTFALVGTVCSIVLLPTLLAAPMTALASHPTAPMDQQWLGQPLSGVNDSASPQHANTYPWWYHWWSVKLAANLLGYVSVLLPVYGASRLTSCWLQNRDRCSQAADASFHDSGLEPATSEHPRHWSELVGCFASLQLAYLTWGVLQERVMTADYGGEPFRDSQFLVFANRLLAGGLGACLVLRQTRCGERRHLAAVPLLDYASCSLSNVLSAWCQYEALVHVTFPTQVLAKAGKIVPVMLMGKLLAPRRVAYRVDQYATAAVISAGTSLFLLSSGEGGLGDKLLGAKATHADVAASKSGDSALSGCALLAGYMLFDSFTSTWQSRLFTRHRELTPAQLMSGTNLLSALMTIAAQLQQGTLPAAVAFASRHPTFLWHAAMLSACSAVGQLVIFHTIRRFGAVTFAVFMTVRQGLAILLSCLAYGHPVGSSGWLGLGLVFGALLLRIRDDRGRSRLSGGKNKKTSVLPA